LPKTPEQVQHGARIADIAGPRPHERRFASSATRQSTPFPDREAIPERSRGLRRLAATPGCDAHTRMNPNGVPEHERRFARGARNRAHHRAALAHQLRQGLARKAGLRTRLNQGTPEAG
jgi:hypothetical protein